MRKFSYVLSDLMNFNEIFRKDVKYDDSKSHKRFSQVLSLSLSLSLCLELGPSLVAHIQDEPLYICNKYHQEFKNS